MITRTSSALALVFVYSYRMTLAPLLGGSCRFEPSCSEYAVQAYRSFGFFEATILVLTRLSKCRPGGSFGPDPVPECGCKHG